MVQYRGKTPIKSAYGVPVLSAKVISNGKIKHPIAQKVTPQYYKEWMRRGYPKVGDIILTTEGPLGEVAELDRDDYGLGQRIVCLRGRSDFLCNKYLKYFFMSPAGQQELKSKATGTTVEGISQKDLRRIKISLPGLREQKIIAEVLGALDDKIELNRKMNATLEAMARALFKSWFVDFDPVRAKSEGREPFGMEADTAALFPSRLVPSALGDIPQGWEERTLQTLADINPETWGENDHPAFVEYVDLANTKWGVIESTTHYSWSAAPSRARRILKPGDTIVGTVRPGNGSFSYIAETNLTGSTGFAVLRPKESAYREAVYFCATASENIERMAHLADGGAYPAIRPEVVLNTAFIFSSDAILDAFAIKATPLVEKIETNKAENKKLAKLRDYLLPKLISGEIRIPDAEKIVGGVV